MSCDKCFSGVRHEGTPEGRVEDFGGVQVYVAIPPTGTEYAKDTAILFLPGEILHRGIQN